ncbi:MAG: M48 family metallopeptidase [Bacteroidales bacterium]|jgi:predicted Zn-dependent protease|nr:M48 family metallopeptidase [Bacteroidales bacterium]
MKNPVKILIALLGTVALVNSCSTVPLTGRKQLSLVSESEIISMSLTNYSTFLKENRLSTNQANAALVQEVGKNISAAVNKYFSDNNMSSRLEGYQWEFNLVNDDATPNAWCMPGGKVVVYTGILPYTKDKDGLAVVLSHEIAHAVARHGSERMSQQMITQFGSIALGEVLKSKPEQTQTVFNTVYGLGAQYGVMLPFSREHELEADKMGLIFMAMAGYDPRTAVAFWERMASNTGQKPPEFMSTHPSDATRIQRIQEAMPTALPYFKK